MHRSKEGGAVYRMIPLVSNEVFELLKYMFSGDTDVEDPLLILADPLLSSHAITQPSLPDERSISRVDAPRP